MEQGHVVVKLLCICHEINCYLSSWQVYNGFSKFSLSSALKKQRTKLFILVLTERLHSDVVELQKTSY